MKKNDWMLIGAVILVIFVLFLFYQLMPRKGDLVIIKKDGEIFATADLDTDTLIDVDQKNTVCIRNGAVYMHHADCPDQLCVRQGRITDSRKQIICLPNRVTVSVTADSEYDAVVR